MGNAHIISPILGQLNDTLQEANNLITIIKEEAKDAGMDWLMMVDDDGKQRALEPLAIRASALNGLATLAIARLMK